MQRRAGATLINETSVFTLGDDMAFRKGQAALDFLMTYGWAIALVVIIAAVLFAMGVFDTSNFVGNKASGFSGVAVRDFRMAPEGNLTLQLMNQVGKRIQVYNVTAVIGTNSGNNTTLVTFATGAQNTITLDIEGSEGGTVGESFTSAVTIQYTDLESGLNHTTSGTLIGKRS
jgi:hypothetical protein